RDINRCRQSAEISMAKDRRVQDVDRFVVETFKDRACKIFVRINDQEDRSRSTRNRRGSTENQTGDIILNNELCAEKRCYRSHIDMPPICAEGKALDPFRTVNCPVGPFISHLRL